MSNMIKTLKPLLQSGWHLYEDGLCEETKQQSLECKVCRGKVGKKINFSFCSGINVLHDYGLIFAGVEQQKLLIMLSIKRHDLSFFDICLMLKEHFNIEKI